MLLSPLVWILEKISLGVSHLIGRGKKQRAVSEDELKAMVDLSAQEGSIEKQEKEFIENVFKLNDINAEDIMTPRVDVDMLDINTTLEEAIAFVNKHEHSRIPIYRDSVDKIIGILYVRDVFKNAGKQGQNLQKTLETISLKKPMKIPLTKKLSKLFQQFQKTHLHMAIVIDEHGGFAGIVTLEDVLEEIVGEIEDEHDSELPLIERVDKHTVIVQGKTEIEDIEKIFDIEFAGEKNDKHDAISWYILERLNRFPREGEELKIANLILRIEAMHENKIERVRITNLKGAKISSENSEIK
ncbi:MAG: hypothetical protein UY05_C0050G0004 [Candidatus Peregrinibacteria bacterium GW2011_GWA2_47_7]|nr:MAG: hypothetical protein UY05_C0050G0004 [Candidatus Peregrinibacteria bacterium GW2011_GWA2_47_7]